MLESHYARLREVKQMAATFVKVQVSGVRQLQAAVRGLSVRVKDLNRAWQRIGSKIASDAIPMAPVLSGTLVNSIRNSKSKTRAIVRAGNGRMEPYVPIQHYGGYNNIQAKPFLTTALHQNEDYAEQEVSNEITRLIRSVGLD